MALVRVGIVGVGGIATSVHIPQLKKCDDAIIVAICDIDSEKLKKVGDDLEILEEYRFKDYKDLIACCKVDAVEVCTPNYLHVPVAVEALKAGKPVNIEKPLAISYEQTENLRKELEHCKQPVMMCFSYRFMPAVRYAKAIMEKGSLGEIISVNVEYLKSSAFWEGRLLDWRFVKEYAGTGVLGDLGVHLIDMTRFLVGDFKNVCSKTGIVVKERKKLNSDEMGKVETDDFCLFMAELENGVHGLFNITRCALGHDNTIKFDIYGKKGVISFDLNNPDVLGVCCKEVDDSSDKLHFIDVPGQYRSLQEQTFIDSINGKWDPYFSSVNEGLKCQKILDAILKSSKEGRWVCLEE